MPITEYDSNVYDYPMARGGVAINKNVDELDEIEAIQTQNMVWKNGMVKRGGQSLITSTEVVASSPILGIHRFYKGDGTRQLLAACGTTVKYFVSPSTWTTIGVTQTTGKMTHFTTWGALNKVFITNGTDDMKSWDGSAAATITIADGKPTQALPYQDRLLTIIGGNLTWSASFDATGGNWLTAASIGVKPDTILYGMCYHSVTNSSYGQETRVLLAGANGMYLFGATDMRTPSTVGDYIVTTLAIPVGCNAPKTMVWTPYGTIWLGVDLQVYLLPFGTMTPVPIGHKIRSYIVGLNGIESIGSSSLSKACAAYHDGYYMLSVPGLSDTVNTVQWWLDVRRLTQDKDGFYGPWFGPMVGQGISCYAVQNGGGDVGELIGGESSSKGYVYQLNRPDVYADISTSTAAAKNIVCSWQTFYNPLGTSILRKDVHKMELEFLLTSSTITVTCNDIDAILRTATNVASGLNVTLWDNSTWGSFSWNDSTPTRGIVDFSPAIQPRRLSLTVAHQNSADAFIVFSMKVHAIQQAQVFA